MKTSREGWISGGASYTAVYVTPEVLSTQDTLRTTYLPICARVYLAFCLSVYLSVCLSVCSSVCFCLFLFVCLFLFLFVCLSVCLFVCLSVFLFCPFGRCSKQRETDFWPHFRRRRWVFYGVGTAVQCAVTLAVLRLSVFFAGCLVLHLGFNSKSSRNTEQVGRKGR